MPGLTSRYRMAGVDETAQLSCYCQGSRFRLGDCPLPNGQIAGSDRTARRHTGGNRSEARRALPTRPAWPNRSGAWLHRPRYVRARGAAATFPDIRPAPRRRSALLQSRRPQADVVASDAIVVVVGVTVRTDQSFPKQACFSCARKSIHPPATHRVGATGPTPPPPQWIGVPR